MEGLGWKVMKVMSHVQLFITVEISVHVSRSTFLCHLYFANATTEPYLFKLFFKPDVLNYVVN